MKKIFLLTAAVALLAMTGCSDFLEIKPVGVLSEADFMTQAGLDQVITGSYARFHRGGDFGSSPSNYQYGDVMGGDANKGSAYSDQPNFTSLETYTIITDNSYLNSKWSWCYDGVFRANTIISMANRIAGLDETFKTQAIAQARFLRAYWHFDALMVFGANIPYVTEEDRDANANPMVSNVDESGAPIFIWEQIAADFQFAYDNLPNTWETAKGRANKWAAAAFLAKLRVFQSSAYDGQNGGSNKWAEAKSILENIMTNGVDNAGTKFRLTNAYETLWIAGESDWNGETIFDFQESISGTQTRTNAVDGGPHIAPPGALGGNSGWGFYQPSYEFVNAHIVDANGLPYLNKAYQNMPVLSKVDPDAPSNVITDLTVYTDPRLDINVGRFHVPYWDWAVPTSVGGWIREVSNGGLYVNKKKMPRKADNGGLSVVTSAGSTAKNFHVIRYAEILLWYAEVLIETGQIAEARQYVNQVRARAANSFVKAADPATMEETTSSYVLDDKVNGTTKANAAANYRIGLWPESQFASKESALAALRFERRIELGMEGKRWFDLARWGIIGAELNSYVAFEKQYLSRYANASYSDNWVTLPIPNVQLQRMPGVLYQTSRWDTN